MEKITELDILQVHYYLSGNSHSMDAKILNRVESELLKIISEVSKSLEIEIFVETQALEEGGIKSIYKFFTDKKNRGKAIAIGGFLATIIGTIISDVVSDSIKTDSETERLKRQQIELTIKKLKNDLAKDSLANLKDVNSVAEPNPEEIEINTELIDSVAVYLSENNKVKISKSKFYEFLLKEGKVEKVSTQELTHDYKPKAKEKVVPRKDFNLFVINDAVIEPDYKDRITLEIVSPVLNRNKMSWKAIYGGQNITFRLKDEDFRNLIIKKNLSFSNGTKLICDIETKQKMNDDGEILESGKTVYTVYQIIYPDGQVIDIK